MVGMFVCMHVCVPTTKTVASKLTSAYIGPVFSDSSNDVDSDLICGDADPCPVDALNDVDSDGVCDSVDSRMGL